MQRFSSIPSFTSLHLVYNEDRSITYETAIYSYRLKSFIYKNVPVESLEHIELDYGYVWISNWKMKGREICDSQYSDVLWQRKKCFCLKTINPETGRRYFPLSEQEHEEEQEERQEEREEEQEEIEVILTPFMSPPPPLTKSTFIQKLCFCINNY
jgi:hypothetical protein